ncbi:hypothetical protein M426DRAFT_12784 [Hypoxylon sp. CI-4A]|nr:hypothetical protein M426DRAFT_12784 [Hypoxylon sp. CI-4A]
MPSQTKRFLGKAVSVNSSATLVKQAAVTQAPTATGEASGKKEAQSTEVVITNSRKPKKTHQATSLVFQQTKEMALPASSDPFAGKYSWASKQESPGLITDLADRCHDQNVLLSHNYYTGDPSHQKHFKYSVKTFVSAPARRKGAAKRLAIAIDCEMVGVAGGKDELAQICAVDLFTGEVLIDALVAPTQPVRNWRTKYSGVTAALMSEAKVSGRALKGWPAARAKIFEFADANTILIGHALNNDLRVLHIAHERVVDSGILVEEAVFGKGVKVPRSWGLKTSARELMEIAIQTSRKGHDCVEDTLASRELVLFCLKEPEKLITWGTKTLIKYEDAKREREERQRKKEEEKAEKEKAEKEKMDGLIKGIQGI